MLQDSPVSKQAWPLDHALFIRSAADTVRRLRNHACIALWCGGNEQTPAADIDAALQAMLPKRPEHSSCAPQPQCQGTEDSSGHSSAGSFAGCLDATRAYVSGSLWSGVGEGHGAFSDGPYGCQQPAAFFDPSFYRWAFNPEVCPVWSLSIKLSTEHMHLPYPGYVSLGQQQAYADAGSKNVAVQVGSVGVPVYETMQEIFPDAAEAAPPQFRMTSAGNIEVNWVLSKQR